MRARERPETDSYIPSYRNRSPPPRRRSPPSWRTRDDNWRNRDDWRDRRNDYSRRENNYRPSALSCDLTWNQNTDTTRQIIADEIRALVRALRGERVKVATDIVSTGSIFDIDNSVNFSQITGGAVHVHETVATDQVGPIFLPRIVL
jgi:hypothetical protein